MDGVERLKYKAQAMRDQSLASLSKDIERILYAMESLEKTEFLDYDVKKDVLAMLEAEGGRLMMQRARTEKAADAPTPPAEEA